MASTEQFVSAPSFSSRNLDFQRKSGKFSISQNRHLGRRKTENIMDNCRNIYEAFAQHLTILISTTPQHHMVKENE